MEIRPGVHTYGLSWTYDEPLGVHVIETSDSTVLFGAGAEETAQELTQIATDHDVDAVVVEHGDVDHFGAVPALRAAVADIEVAVPAGDAVFLENAGIEADHALDPDETYRGIRTIAAPGHTPDNMAYLVTEEDVLVAGDTVVGSDSTFAADRDWSGDLATIAAEYNADDELARESVRALTGDDFDVVLVSHGTNVTEGGRQAVETLVADLS